MADLFPVQLDFPSRNALSPEVIDFLENQLAQAAGAPLLLSGTSQAFCAGLDLRYLVSLDLAGVRDYLLRVDRLAQRLYEYPGPTAALVEGHAIAGGCVLVQACDWRVASDQPKLRIGVTELALGAAYPPRILRLLARRLPPRQVERVLFGAQLVDPAGALEAGLLDEVGADAPALARAFLERVGGYPQGAFACSKAGLRQGKLEPSAQDLKRFEEQELALWAGDEIRARIRAVLGD